MVEYIPWKKRLGKKSLIAMELFSLGDVHRFGSSRDGSMYIPFRRFLWNSMIR